MSSFWVIIFFLHIGASVLASDPKVLKCLVCRKVVEEVEREIATVSPTKTIEVGSFRLDPHGNQKQKTVPYARSTVHLSEVLENICQKFSDYVKATYKSSGDLTILKLIDENGKMNSEMAEVDIVPDADLNKSLKFYCEGIVEEYEDDFLKHFAVDDKDVDIKLCSGVANLCDVSNNEDYVFEDREDL
ncbi:protein seele [Ischnura elegans]|uniref:protein seele n=1 Tax=Ischnura elegans TaxID=197161 RepID=UPI001ED8743F|nr:protein seele [Ischnura elegans]XP_046399705.1 protein seele [Ischnura elegans]